MKFNFFPDKLKEKIKNFFTSILSGDILSNNWLHSSSFPNYNQRTSFIFMYNVQQSVVIQIGM